MELRDLGSQAELLVHVWLWGTLYPPENPRLDATELDLCLLVRSLAITTTTSSTTTSTSNQNNNKLLSCFSGIQVFTCSWFLEDNSLWQIDQGVYLQVIKRAIFHTHTREWCNVREKITMMMMMMKKKSVMQFPKKFSSLRKRNVNNALRRHHRSRICERFKKTCLETGFRMSLLLNSQHHAMMMKIKSCSSVPTWSML